MSDHVRVTKIPVDQVHFHTHNVRRDLGDLRGLAKSIKRFGVMQPIVVENYGDTLRLRAGHRRLAAARMAGLKRIPALVHDTALEDDEWLVASVQENVMRRGIDKEERRAAILKLRELGCTWDGVAEAFGVQKSTVQNWVYGRGNKKRPKNQDARIYPTSLGRVLAAWREEATRRRVTTDELLDALDTITTAGAVRDAFPDELASRRRSA